MLRTLLVLLWLGGVSGFAQTVKPEAFPLQFSLLTPSLDLMNAGDRQVVQRAIELIRNGEDGLALVQLRTLTERNPRNSSLRILTAYALLQAGNLTGAFEEAKSGESAPDHNAYACWFLAKIAFLTGDTAACKRELKHVRDSGQLSGERKELESQLQAKAKMGK